MVTTAGFFERPVNRWLLHTNVKLVTSEWVLCVAFRGPNDRVTPACGLGVTGAANFHIARREHSKFLS